MTWTTVFLHPGELGESPFWHPHEQALYWLDIPARQLHRGNPLTGERDSWAMPSEPGCMAPMRDGGLVIALREGIYSAAQWGGELKLLANAIHDPVTTRFNDGKADPMGRFWAGTIYEPRDTRSAALYCLDARDESRLPLELKAGEVTVANGLAWSPNGNTLYWTDTSTAIIRAWDWDRHRNLFSNEHVFKQWPAKPHGWKAGQANQPSYEGRPDGAAVDLHGNYYVAMFEGAQVLKISPTGDVLEALPVPAQCPTMPCFGGPDLKTLFVTTARKDRPASELLTYPDSGCVFSMPVDVPGLPVNFFLAATLVG